MIVCLVWQEEVQIALGGLERGRAMLIEACWRLWMVNVLKYGIECDMNAVYRY
jgi:hypothetical protein